MIAVIRRRRSPGTAPTFVEGPARGGCSARRVYDRGEARVAVEGGQVGGRRRALPQTRGGLKGGSERLERLVRHVGSGIVAGQVVVDDPVPFICRIDRYQEGSCLFHPA